MREGAEECDTSSGGCVDCEVQPGWVCDDAVGVESTCSPTCGNEAMDALEECDDGNIDENDGCGPTCKFEAGWTCTGDLFPVCTSDCGDGF